MEELADGEEKAGDVVVVASRATRVEHVKQVAVQRETDGPVAFGTDCVRQRQAIRRHGKDRDFVTAGIAGKEPSSLLVQNYGTLVAESAAGAGATGGEDAGGRERTIGGALEGKHVVAVGGVVHHVNGTLAASVIVSERSSRQKNQRERGEFEEGFAIHVFDFG